MTGTRPLYESLYGHVKRLLVSLRISFILTQQTRDVGPMLA